MNIISTSDLLYYLLILNKFTDNLSWECASQIMQKTIAQQSGEPFSCKSQTKMCLRLHLIDVEVTEYPIILNLLVYTSSFP